MPFVFIACTMFAVARAATDVRCPSKSHQLIEENDLTPVGIKRFLGTNALSDPGDFACCLPPQYQKNFIVVHSSASAQSSDYHGPRIVMFNKINPNGWESPSKFLTNVITMNGGKSSLSNANNVEVAHVDSPSGEVGLYDIDFAGGRGAIGGRNPSLCLNCHGKQGQVGIGGPKFVFEPFDQWTRVVNGVHSCGDGEIALRKALQKSTIQNIKDNPRYRCLDFSEIVANATNDRLMFTKEINDLHTGMNTLNAIRVSHVMRATPNFEKFKYAVLGALTCMSSNVTDLFGDENRNFAGWIPDSVLKAMTDVTTIAPEFKKGRPLDALNVNLLAADRERKRINLTLPAAALAVAKNQPIDFDLYRGPLSNCRQDVPPAGERVAEVRKTLNGPPTLDLYKIDAAANGFRGTRFSPFLRYVFEARGIPIDDFAMDPSPQSYPVTPQMLGQAIVVSEPAGSPLARLRDDLARAGTPIELLQTKNSSELTEEAERDTDLKICDRLKRLSIEALADSKATAPSPAPSPTTAH